MKVGRHSSQCQVFKPYVITINVNSLHDEGILRTLTARMSVIPEHLRDAGHHHFDGATTEEIYNLLANLDHLILVGKECN